MVEPRLGDAFGEALLRTYAEGGSAAHVAEIIERDDAHIDAGNYERYFATFEHWQERDQWAVGQARGRCLDIGAGAGRISLHLRDAGHEVVALDTSPGAVEVCRLRGLRETFLGTVFELAETSPGTFDTFLLLGNNLGLLESREHARRFLAVLMEMAAPGARILGSSLDIHQTTSPSNLAKHRHNRDAGKMPGQNVLRVRFEDMASEWFGYLMLSQAELMELLDGTGWAVTGGTKASPQYAVLIEQS